MDTAKFISKAIRIHGSKFDYSDIVYSNCSDKLKIKCFAHGIFEQTSLSHLSGKGCPSCAPNARLTTETFLEFNIRWHTLTHIMIARKIKFLSQSESMASVIY
jgi:hypothetical protein